MYPNLYYVFRDWFGVEWKFLSFLNTFGLFVAIAFVAAALAMSSELKRKEKLGLLSPREEVIVVGKPASFFDLLVNALVGFFFGYKVLGLFLNKPDEVPAQDYVFSGEGSVAGGILLAAIMAGMKWWEKKKQKLPAPEKRLVRIWPHDRVGDFVILGLIFGIIGAKLFDSFENWDEFLQDPVGRLFSASGLTFYGGLIVAAIVICWYAYRKGISIKHLVDATAPALMIAYAVGRIGCQVSGDGDWGVFNSAYTSDEMGKVSVAKPGDFQQRLEKYSTYFTDGKLLEGDKWQFITNRKYGRLDQVPHKSFKGPGFLPNWFFAYTYPQNVNIDGVLIPGNSQEHNRVLPQPVFPTPLYETIICTLMFLGMWFFRRSIKTPWVMFGVYLMLNGAERFFIETMRVNNTFTLLGIRLTQAELIAVMLFLSGALLVLYAKWSGKPRT